MDTLYKKIVYPFLVSLITSVFCFGQNIRGYIHITDQELRPQETNLRTTKSGNELSVTNNVKMNQILADQKVQVYKQAFPTAHSQWLRDVYYIESESIGTYDDIENGLKGKVDLVEILEDKIEVDYTPDDYTLLCDRVDFDLIHVKEAWDIVKDIPKLPIAVSDTYFDTTHPDLVGQFVNDIANNDPTIAKAYHGTQVAGIIAAIPDNKKGLPGIGFGMKVYGTTSYDLNELLKIAQAGYRVINCSWSIKDCYEGSAVDDSVFREIRDVWNCAVVASAGNGLVKELPIECGCPSYKRYPASYPAVVSVTSVGHSRKYGTIDSNGDKMFWEDCHENKIGDTLSTYQHNTAVDICAPGFGIWTTTYPGKSYDAGYGTSFSAPQVSATIGLVLSINPSLSAKQAIDIVLNNSDSSIYNIPENAPYIGLLGKGRLNVYRAVLKATESATERLNRPYVYTVPPPVNITSNYAIRVESPFVAKEYAMVNMKARREVAIYNYLEVGENASFAIYTGMNLPVVK